MRLPVLSLVFLTSACGSSSSGTIARTPGPPAAVIPTGSGADVRLSRDDRALEDVIPASYENTWAATRALYVSLGVPLSRDDPQEAVMATATFAAPRRFLDQPLSALLDCGQSISGPRVNLWAVRMEIATAVRRVPEGGTRVGTLVTAHARNRDGSSVQPVPCSSTGAVEREIARRIHGNATR